MTPLVKAFQKAFGKSFQNYVTVVVVVDTRLLPRNIGREFQKLGNPPRLGPKSFIEKELPDSVQRRVSSCTVQNEMSGVLGRMVAGAA